ncbi:MAG: TIGR02996 domain-containing protein, partial [Gemmataceae bacterium]
MSADKAKGFLDFIVAHPDDDVHRLVFADWYEEQGDAARAEFIRVQVEIARLPEWDVRQVTLRLRQRALLKQHGTQWKAELPTIKGVKWGEFRRGLVGAATFDSYSVLRKQAGACWAAAPIEAISIRWPRPRERVETLPPIPGLRELSINAMLVDPLEVDRLAATPLLSTLRVLEMSNCSVGTDSFRRLLASPQLGNLTALRVPANAIGNGGISALFDAASLTGLTELDLSESDGGGGGGGGGYGRYGEDPIVESLGMRALAGWPGLAQLRSLKLSGNQAGRDGLRALLRSPHARGLKELAFRANHLDGPAVQEFCDAHPDLELEVLDLGANLLRELGAAYLARSSCLRDL